MSRVFKISEGIPILEGMFKGIDRSMLESILVECGNDVDKAATALDGIFPDARIPLPSATSSTSTTVLLFFITLPLVPINYGYSE